MLPCSSAICFSKPWSFPFILNWQHVPLSIYLFRVACLSKQQALCLILGSVSCFTADLSVCSRQHCVCCPALPWLDFWSCRPFLAYWGFEFWISSVLRCQSVISGCCWAWELLGRWCRGSFMHCWGFRLWLNCVLPSLPFKVLLFEAVSLKTFFGAFCPSEVITSSKFDASHRALQWGDTHFTKHGLSLLLHFSKTDQYAWGH